MGNMSLSMFIVTVFVIVIFYYSQSKFKNKMLCSFIRPNRQKIEKWVPLLSTYVTFDRGRYGIGHYECDPECITMVWYERGINKFFPTLIPTLEFKWDTPNPLNPKTFTSTWHTPEARHAAWQEHQHVAFAKSTQQASGKKGRIPEWVLPLATIALILIVLYIVYNGMSGLDHRLFDLEQQLKLIR